MAKKKQQNPETTITLYDVADNATRRERAAAVHNKYSTKNTLNLCMKEKSAVTYEIFFLVLAIVLIFLLIVEYFGVYRPYRAAEEADAALAADRATLKQKNDKLSDYDEVRENYLKYNYENFNPEALADREDVLAFLEEVVFPAGKVTTFYISGNTLTMVMEEVSLESLSQFYIDLEEYKPLVSAADVRQTGGTKDAPTLTVTITLAEVPKGGN